MVKSLRTSEEWNNHVIALESSGKGVREYATLHGLSINHLYRKRKKYRNSIGSATSVPTRSTSKKQVNGTKFIRAQISPTPSSSSKFNVSYDVTEKDLVITIVECDVSRSAHILNRLLEVI